MTTINSSQTITNAKAPNIGVVPTPPLRAQKVEKDILDISGAKAPDEIKKAGNKKKKPANIVSYLWFGAMSIWTAVMASDLIKLIKKH